MVVILALLIIHFVPLILTLLLVDKLDFERDMNFKNRSDRYVKDSKI